MKAYVLKSIDVKSIFKFFGGMFMVIGMIIGIFGGIAGLSFVPNTLVRFMPFFGFPQAAKIGIATILGALFGLMYGVTIGVVYAIAATAYNIFAKIFGGIKIDLEQKD